MATVPLNSNTSSGSNFPNLKEMNFSPSEKTPPSSMFSPTSSNKIFSSSMLSQESLVPPLSAVANDALPLDFKSEELPLVAGVGAVALTDSSFIPVLENALKLVPPHPWVVIGSLAIALAAYSLSDQGGDSQDSIKSESLPGGDDKPNLDPTPFLSNHNLGSATKGWTPEVGRLWDTGNDQGNPLEDYPKGHEFPAENGNPQLMNNEKHPDEKLLGTAWWGHTTETLKENNEEIDKINERITGNEDVIKTIPFKDPAADTMGEYGGPKIAPVNSGLVDYLAHEYSQDGADINTAITRATEDMAPYVGQQGNSAVYVDEKTKTLHYVADKPDNRLTTDRMHPEYDDDDDSVVFTPQKGYLGDVAMKPPLDLFDHASQLNAEDNVIETITITTIDSLQVGAYTEGLIEFVKGNDTFNRNNNASVSSTHDSTGDMITTVTISGLFKPK